MGEVSFLKCITCGRVYKKDEVQYVCPQCGPIRGTLEVYYDYDKLRKSFKKPNKERGPYTHFRYLPLLPIEGKFLPLQKVGWTPLIRATKLEKELGIGEIYIKDEGLNPSGSLKDRASSIAVVHALELNKKRIVAASTGNAASSLAVLSAPMGIESIIFVPKGAPKAKLAQLLVFGAKVFEVKGTYDDAYDLAMEVADRLSFYSRNTAYNPYLGEGKKTVAFEIAEQLDYNPPTHVIVPVGDGCIVQSVYKGFLDFKRVGFISHVPIVIGVQAEGSSPLAKAFELGKEEVDFEEEVYTIADSIRVSKPRDQVKALKYVRESGGKFVTVSDEEILSAIPYLARNVGIFGEPAGVAGIAALKKLVEDGTLDSSSRVVVLMTGNGLKDIDSAIKSVEKKPIEIEREVEFFLNLWRREYGN